MTAVIIALIAGVFTGALVIWLVTRGQGRVDPAVMQSQGEIKARLDEALMQVQHLGAIFGRCSQSSACAAGHGAMRSTACGADGSADDRGSLLPAGGRQVSTMMAGMGLLRDGQHAATVFGRMREPG
jgi:hypothetical protein